MNNLPVYSSYNGEKEIALLDNSSIAFLEQMHRDGFDVQYLLRLYDAILVPGWVVEEVWCSPFRSQYLLDLQNDGIPIYRVNEEEMIVFSDGDEAQMLYIVKAAVMCLGELRSYIRKKLSQKTFWIWSRMLSGLHKCIRSGRFLEILWQTGIGRKRMLVKSL